MYQTPDQLLALNKANLEVAARFAGVALHGAERLVDLQLKTAKAAFADGIENAKALAAVKDLQEFAALKDQIAQPSLEKATAYAKGVFDLATATQAEFGRLVEQQFADFNKQVVTGLDKLVKNAPAGSEFGIAAFKSGIAAVNSTYDNLSKVARQFTEATQTNMDVVAKQATAATRKARK